ncbi:histidinol dehydrogenase [Emcibacter sp.]|uniref:histidinol dehydrogenase n=1 Tax=Emcibacter sp. TaxID=1979954 RepID=UPI002AA74AA7|nr:histidinol dehydrogenase [Emcibacter sp.]
MVSKLDNRKPGFEEDFIALLNSKRESDQDVSDAVKAILDDVRKRGDAAVIDYTSRFDRLELTPETMRVSAEEIAAARAQVSDDVMTALQEAAARIEVFHKRHLPEDDSFTDEAGVTVGARWSAVDAAGIYVPGGKAVYPSSVLMNAIPAKAAGVDRIVMVVPAPDGFLNPLVLVAAELAGVTEIYRIGGAQAVGALAYGTETISPVDVITGPGNAYVAAAKREVFGTVGIDMIAGPSEILVVADGKNDPRWIAMDLLSQAEHDEVAQSILITDDEVFAKMVADAVEDHLATLPRATIARTSWDDHGAIIVVGDLSEAAPLVNRLAPEHLELAVDNARELARDMKHAGSIFLGRYTPEAIGDYVAGPNHVLPTARNARFTSGLSALNFMKRNTLIECSQESLARIGPAAVILANEEGLQAHGQSISIRLDKSD